MSKKSQGKSEGAVKKSISLPASLLGAAEQRAQKQGRSLSNYLQTLVRRDLGEGVIA